MADRLTQIHLEIAINGSRFNPLDSPEDSQTRQQLAAQCVPVPVWSENIDNPENTR